MIKKHNQVGKTSFWIDDKLVLKDFKNVLKHTQMNAQIDKSKVQSINEKI